jgi:hypothetical protein
LQIKILNTYLHETTESQVVYLILVAIPRKVAFYTSRATHEKDIGFSGSRPVETRSSAAMAA